MTENREAILNYLYEHDQITLKTAVELFGYTYHFNAQRHLGVIFGRMVDSGVLIRINNGVFELAPAPKQETLKGADLETGLPLFKPTKESK